MNDGKARGRALPRKPKKRNWRRGWVMGTCIYYVLFGLRIAVEVLLMQPPRRDSAADFASRMTLCMQDLRSSQFILVYL